MITQIHSQLLTTFICPFDRFKYKRLPFGLNCSTEHFVIKFSNLLKDLKVIYHVDDILIYGNTIEEHDSCLSINKEKRVIGVEVKFLGYISSSEGISVDPERIEAITKLPEPKNETELQRVLSISHLNI